MKNEQKNELKKELETITKETVTENTLKFFPFLIKELKKSFFKRLEKFSEDIKEYNNYIFSFLTEKKAQELKEKKITRKTAQDAATKKYIKDLKISYIKDINKLNTAANAEDLSWARVTVEWVRNRTWGMCPHVTTATGCGYYTASATGCGYDKESAAISNTFDDSPEITKILYIREEKRIKSKNERQKARRDVIGYGTGTSTIPYFEGGCGVSCFYHIFKKCGYNFINTASGKTFDAYEIKKAVSHE